MSLLSSSRIVLIMSDEGLQIYQVSGAGIKEIEFVSWDTDSFKEYVQHILANKCKKKPVVIFNDMVEQHYRKERIPKVGFGDKSSIIKSRLNYVFPNNQIRAALKLNKKFNTEGGGDPYLFAAIPKSESFNKTFSAVLASGSKLVGFYLLPIEGTALIEQLSKKLNKGNKTQSVWTIFIGQQSNGGLRQIVTRNGELALTRMTPIVDTDIEASLWANEVSEELEATMSYLSRFGYKKEDGLDIVIISNSSTHADLQQIINVEADLRLMSSKDVADMVGARIGMPTDLRYTDPLYAAYLGRKARFLLPMQSNAIDSVTRPRKIAGFVTMGLLAACAYVGFLSFQNVTKYVELKDSLSVTQQQLKTQEREYKIQADKMKELGVDLLMVDSALKNYYELDQKKVSILPFLNKVASSLGPDLTISSISVEAIENDNQVDAYGYAIEGETEGKKVLLNTNVMLTFPPTISAEEGVKEVENLVARLSENLEGFNVEIARQVAGMSYTGNVTGGTAQSSDDGPEDYVAEINIVEKE